MARGQGNSEKSVLASAALVAVEPLIDLLLDLGVTCPEAESLFRSMFLHKAKDRLKGYTLAEDPSDLSVSLLTGVHRNFVRTLLTGPPIIPVARSTRGRTVQRLIDGWQNDSRFLDKTGRPLELHLAGPEPSFKSLVTHFLPGMAPSLVLSQLRRMRLVENLADGRLKFRAPDFQAYDATKLGSIGRLVRDFFESLLRGQGDQKTASVWFQVQVEVPSGEISLARERIRRAAETCSKKIVELRRRARKGDAGAHERVRRFAVVVLEMRSDSRTGKS